MKKLLKISSILTVAVLGFAPIANAKSKPKKKHPKVAEVVTASISPEETQLSEEFETESEIAAYVKELKNSRRPASGVVAEETRCKWMADFQASLLSARTGADINARLNDLNPGAAAASKTDLGSVYARFEASDDAKDPKCNDFKYFGARMLPFRKMGGYVWRMVPVVEGGQIVASQELLLGALRNMAEEIAIHAPGSHNEAIFRFFTEPQAGQTKRFENERDVQNFYVAELAPQISTAIKRISAIKLSTPISLDERLRFGDVQMASGEKKFRLIGEAEKHAVLARMWRRMAAINVFAAYDQVGYLEVRRDLGRKQGIDAAISGGVLSAISDSEINGVTREERVRILKGKHSNPNFWNLDPKNGAAHMQFAYIDLYNSVNEMRKSNAALKLPLEKESNDWLLEPEVMLSRSDQTDHTLAQLWPLVIPANPKYVAHDTKSGAKYSEGETKLSSAAHRCRSHG